MPIFATLGLKVFRENERARKCKNGQIRASPKKRENPDIPQLGPKDFFGGVGKRENAKIAKLAIFALFPQSAKIAIPDNLGFKVFRGMVKCANAKLGEIGHSRISAFAFDIELR